MPIDLQSAVLGFAFYGGAILIPAIYLAIGGFRARYSRPMFVGGIVQLTLYVLFIVLAEVVSWCGYSDAHHLLILWFPVSFLAYVYYVFVLALLAMSIGEKKRNESA